MRSEVMNGKNILLTGGGGFIGANIRNCLIGMNCSVVTVSRSTSNSGHHVSLDLSKKKDVLKLIESKGPFDVVIHCAAIAHGDRPPGGKSISEFNSSMVTNLSNAFGDSQPHWIFMSSVSVYGKIQDDTPTPISIIPDAVDKYGQGKLDDELLLTKLCNRLDIFRLAPVYDSKHMNDIKKRVFIPKTNIKLIIRPSPYYTFCDVSIVGNKVLECLSYSSGKNLHQVGDLKPMNQHDLVKKFDGISIIVPKLIFRFLVLVLPSKIGVCNIFINLLKKLAFNNIYEVGIKKL